MHFFVKMVLNYFLGPFQNVANSACPGSPFLSHGKIDKKNALFRENAFKLFSGSFPEWRKFGMSRVTVFKSRDRKSVV